MAKSIWVLNLSNSLMPSGKYKVGAHVFALGNSPSMNSIVGLLLKPSGGGEPAPVEKISTCDKLA
jgi:hypothetical protein